MLDRDAQPGSPHWRCAIKPRSASDFYVRNRTIANTFHVAAGLFVFRTSQACSFGFRYNGQLVFFWVRHSAISVLSARGYHALLLVTVFYA
jgi:hypothetical protein